MPTLGMGNFNKKIKKMESSKVDLSTTVKSKTSTNVSLIHKEELEEVKSDSSSEKLRKQYPLANFDIKKEIGRGSNGLVASAIDKRIGKEMAIKRIPDVFVSKGATLRLWREVSILNQLPSHPCIVKLYDIVEPTKDPKNFKSIFLVF